MRLVDPANEVRFLQPLPIALLPLPPLAVQQLAWLGIRTLGQFARLPATAVWQRFGAEGKLAQKWAQGRDDRPVRPTVEESAPPLSLDFDPPTELRDSVVDVVVSALRPSLAELARQLQGCRRLHINLRFADDSVRTIDCTFVEPVSSEIRVRATLMHQLEVLNWPAELSSTQVALLEFGELAPHQLTLFEMDDNQSPFLQVAERLSRRYGPIFFRSELSDAGHPVPERRLTVSDLSVGHAL
jgi:nucleotidyltransferase/DNA polymerase involved in DNA repair